MPRPKFALWPLPLFIALVFLGAVHLAWWLSLQAGYIPACNPYWEGCTSVSRAARHGLGNHLFRLAVLPCALLHALNWWLATVWLREGEVPMRRTEPNLLLMLGLLSALALALYATFLGTEGETYRFLRRYGVVLYFGCGFLAQLLFMRLAMRGGRLQGVPARGMQGICVTMLALGVMNVAASAFVADADLRDRIENVLEWQLGLLLVGWFILQALCWRRDGYALVLSRRGAP
ncbi:hypothetical protein [Pseudoxanthomonas wuyuanensis]